MLYGLQELLLCDLNWGCDQKPNFGGVMEPVEAVRSTSFASVPHGKDKTILFQEMKYSVCSCDLSCTMIVCFFLKAIFCRRNTNVYTLMQSWLTPPLSVELFGVACVCSEPTILFSFLFSVRSYRTKFRLALPANEMAGWISCLILVLSSFSRN